jgi:hypothetical protein
LAERAIRSPSLIISIMFIVDIPLCGARPFPGYKPVRGPGVTRIRGGRCGAGG